MLVIGLITDGQQYFRRGRLIDEVVLPLTRLGLVAYRRIERGIAAKAPVHVNDLLIRNTEALRNQRHLLGRHIAAFHCCDPVFCRPHLKKHLLLAFASASFPNPPPSPHALPPPRSSPPPP